MTKKKYKLLDHDITIHWQDKVTNDNGEWIYGYTHFDANDVNIYISTKNSSGKSMSEQTINNTVRHELLHVIFGILYYDDLSTNEHLIEWLTLAFGELKKQKLDI